MARIDRSSASPHRPCRSGSSDRPRASRPSPATPGGTTRAAEAPEPAAPKDGARALARIGRPEARRASTAKAPAAQNPSSVFSTLCAQLSDKPISKLADALPSADDAQAKLQGLEDATGLRAGPKASLQGRLGPKLTAERAAQAGDLRHDTRAGLDLGADGDASGQVTVGLAGARAHGELGGQVGLGGHLNERWSHPLGELEVDADAHARAQARARGDATLDARGLNAHGEIGAKAEAEARGRAKADTVFGSAEGEVAAQAKAYANADADVHAGLEGLGARAQGEIGAAAAVEAAGEARSAGVKLGGEEVDLRVKAKGRAEACAKAEGDLKADLRMKDGRPTAGVDIGGRAFAGARAEGEVGVGLGDIATVKARGGAGVGAGAEGRAKLHFDGKKLKVGLRGGAALKGGAGGGATVEVDVEKAANAGIGAAVMGITAPIRYALDPSALPRDASSAVTMGLGMGRQLVGLPGQVLAGARDALGAPVEIAA